MANSIALAADASRLAPGPFDAMPISTKPTPLFGVDLQFGFISRLSVPSYFRERGAK